MNANFPLYSACLYLQDLSCHGNTDCQFLDGEKGTPSKYCFV